MSVTRSDPLGSGDAHKSEPELGRGLGLAAHESAASFAEIARAMAVPGSLARTRGHVTELAVDVIDACDYADLAVPDRGGELEVVATTSREIGLATRHEPGGPREQATTSGMCTVDDFSTDPRWPRLAEWAAANGFGCMCSVRLATDRQATGVLTLYGVTPGRFDAATRERAAVYATHASLALDGAAVEARLSEAIATRQSIGQAVGILMERHGVGAGYAFALVVKASTARAISIRDLADAIVSTGADPMVAVVPRAHDDVSPAPRRSIQPLSDGRTGFRLSGAVEGSSSRQLRSALKTATSSAHPVVHLELGGLDYIDIASARVLIETAWTLRGRGGRLVLLEAPSSLARLLDVLRAGRAMLGDALVVEGVSGAALGPFTVGADVADDPLAWRDGSPYLENR